MSSLEDIVARAVDQSNGVRRITFRHRISEQYTFGRRVRLLQERNATTRSSNFAPDRFDMIPAIEADLTLLRHTGFIEHLFGWCMAKFRPRIGCPTEADTKTMFG